ncbi:uncharacterized protein PFB0765w-like [Tribolium madens]|uniref:uncharacterized protein PFB0765w-like n=1 Tax=Tribolium madens TaxID=41895 RepID=UPI001CF72728|nr:uncharacterized protein PFB0765w-like [Tribolium madens]
MDPLENVDEVLREIERKYSFTNDECPKTDLEEQLQFLSQDFETLGLPPIDLKKSNAQLLEQVVNNSLSLVQLHRKTISQISDLGICNRSKEIKNNDLERDILHLKLKLRTTEDQNLNLQRKLSKVNSECEVLNKKLSMHNTETDKLKQYYKSKLNEMVHHINSLKNENHHLREMCGKDIDKYFSKEDKFLKILKKHKQTEEVYKSALQKLEDNNTEIMNEILNLKEELALAYLKKE